MIRNEMNMFMFKRKLPENASEPHFRYVLILHTGFGLSCKLIASVMRNNFPKLLSVQCLKFIIVGIPFDLAVSWHLFCFFVFGFLFIDLLLSVNNFDFNEKLLITVQKYIIETKRFSLTFLYECNSARK